MRRRDEGAMELIEIRPARSDDAPHLAELIDIAGEGIPSCFWAQAAEGGESALDVGIKRASRETGGFSYRNATVLCAGERVLGMLLGYRLPDPYDAGDLEALPAVVRPLVELEALAPGSWYVNAVAVYPESRGHGLGTRLLGEAERLAVRDGCRRLSIIVAEDNDGAVSLYRRVGYLTVDARSAVVIEGTAHRGDWLLMVKELEG
jgi:ribosomal protein S18 acetylase RimI-like enzyme